MDLDKVVVPVHWYALRVTYCRELVLKSWLDEQGTVNFVPMRYELVEKEGRKSRKLVPAVHNLVFVHTSRRGLESLCSHPELPVPVRYFYSRETRRPLVIPDNQMQNFIAVAGNYEESVLYLDPVDLQLSKGTRVRITGGVFEGVEGVFIRVRHDRRVVVCIEGITAVATTFVPPSLVEPIGSVDK
ncbi:MAG TPA: UpxY family transcription antiterminator [Mediterranea massiliensis]|uniref:UpxY family transcription antiterminator n=1 Tax=Mediterranea massiliensis TaxID=1841865 RepID=A0A921HWE8_9BACT|nr:UpxY family transcription antiterminator [Mediterranea massiliensis]CCZ47239.1 transcription termination/antitermination factor NusG [Bacteroides sp. CAG:661]HJF92145.1 UpxY family transcription antiterminator [Mediterranea massiliensis]